MKKARKITAQEGAFSKGAEAASKRQPRKSNPYKPAGKGCSFYHAWDAGWHSVKKCK